MRSDTQLRQARISGSRALKRIAKRRTDAHSATHKINRTNYPEVHFVGCRNGWYAVDGVSDVGHFGRSKKKALVAYVFN